ncbi:hypothetical protein ABPG72_011223 [Tetrahymena utriculariae]
MLTLVTLIQLLPEKLLATQLMLLNGLNLFTLFIQLSFNGQIYLLERVEKQVLLIQPLTKLWVQGVIFKTALAAFLLFVPGVQDIFGGRPLSFWIFGVPGLFISSTLLVWDELRKFSTRTNRWFLKYALF